ncbi:MAG: hypothetical protein DYG94_02105 [Leptolyngbya sp. PLA3]|nr:MAG: hypothetical protein EDM82_02450 [Cyanobacteria bacterium CYA]MCE7967525.1 hypothetical protein [Leptolyngbya sp. PL-A3]
MPYPSVDKLQRALAEDVFAHTNDKKKASGRALGTFVELVTFYTLCAWGFRNATAIERPAPEFANPEITHNVEFSIHPIVGTRTVTMAPLSLPLTSKKLYRSADPLSEGSKIREKQIYSRNGVMRNAAVVAECASGFTTSHIDHAGRDDCTVTLTDLLTAPFAIVECKRVGVEEGMRKGPQTIEKAKQGAYVARTVSSLQKFRLQSGKVQGVIDVGKGRLRTGEYDTLLRQVIDGIDPDELRHFILTVGVVSNHGNWFTSQNQNKELRVLAHSYDWLLFLTDSGLSQFIDELLIKPARELKPAKDAFLASYCARKTGNFFTKVKIDAQADQALKRYFQLHEGEIEAWFNVIAPEGGTLEQLRTDLKKLADKDWRRIRSP